jgi:hypothetical protein
MDASDWPHVRALVGWAATSPVLDRHSGPFECPRISDGRDSGGRPVVPD